MDSQNFVVTYARACGSGNLPFSECGPVWQCGLIAVFLVAAVALLIMLRLHAYTQSARS